MPNIINHIESSINLANNDLLTYSLSILKYAFRHTDPGLTSNTAQEECKRICSFLTQALSHN